MTDLSAAEAPSQGALARLMRRKMAVVGLVIIALVVAGAVWVADAALAPPMAVAARSPAPASAIPIRERVVGAM